MNCSCGIYNLITGNPMKNLLSSFIALVAAVVISTSFAPSASANESADAKPAHKSEHKKSAHKSEHKNKKHAKKSDHKDAKKPQAKNESGKFDNKSAKNFSEHASKTTPVALESNSPEGLESMQPAAGGQKLEEPQKQ
jgi:Ni/Co efflux regulator RcnB